MLVIFVVLKKCIFGIRLTNMRLGIIRQAGPKN
jgi:hypothetical protein